MNAQVVIAVSSLVVGLFCVIFFYLAGQEGFDENSVFWGTLETDQLEDDAGTIKIKFTQDGYKSMYAELPDGTSEMLTMIDDELVRFDYDANGDLVRCGSNIETDIEQMNNFFVELVDGVIVVGDQGEETAEMSLTYEFKEGAAPEGFYPAFPSMEECKAVALAAAEDGGRRQMQEDADAIVDRRLSWESQLSKDSYDGCTYTGGSHDNACVKISGCAFAFRGSDDIHDWLSNGFGVFASYKKNGRWLHGGFVNEFNKLEGKIRHLVNGCGNPKWIGHSLGGAIASVARNHYGKGTVYTWGQPKTYDNHEGCFEQGGIRMYNEWDPVPGNLFRVHVQLPPRPPGHQALQTQSL
jgi:hypothetical protein